MERNIDTAYVQHFDDAYTLSRDANRLGYDAIVAIGGDGTINKVLNGFYNSSGERISDARFGVIHTGTSPDFCKSYGIPLNIEDAVLTLTRQRTRHIPVGMIRYLRPSGGEVTRHHEGDERVSYFACCANIGLGASLARKANAGIRKRIGDVAGAFVSLIHILSTYQPDEYVVNIDGVSLRYDSVYNITVGLTPHIASGLKLSPQMTGGERRFYVLTLRNLNPGNLLPMLYSMYSGRPFSNTEYLFVQTCGSLCIPERHTQFDVESDGDPCGELPCSIHIAKDDLELIH